MIKATKYDEFAFLFVEVRITNFRLNNKQSSFNNENCLG